MERIQQVEASLNYLADSGQKPVSYLYDPPEGTPSQTGNYAKFQVPIRNGREILEQLSLDGQGFILVGHDSEVSNFYDDEEVRRVYYPEIESLVKRATGAARVTAFDHNVRCRPKAKRGDAGVRAPVKFVHNDYTVKSGPQRVRELMPEEADALLGGRFAVVNVWRPIRNPVQDIPLAVCDAQSLAQDDFVTHDLKYADRTGEIYSVRFSPRHRWFYFPEMHKHEALLLKCYDSDPERARFTAHSAFDNPASPPDALPRESIEVRTLVFFTS